MIDAIAKTVAELTSQQDGLIRQQLIEQLMREIMNYDAEYRREDAAGGNGSHGTALEVLSRPLGRADWHLAILTLPQLGQAGGGLA